MAKITIYFNKWSLGKMWNNTKETTCRKKKMGKKGDNFEIKGAKYTIEDVLKCKLWIVAKQFHKEEGCKDEMDFVAQWRKIYPNDVFDPNEIVYLHFFKKAE